MVNTSQHTENINENKALSPKDQEVNPGKTLVKPGITGLKIDLKQIFRQMADFPPKCPGDFSISFRSPNIQKNIGKLWLSWNVSTLSQHLFSGLNTWCLNTYFGLPTPDT